MKRHHTTVGAAIAVGLAVAIAAAGCTGQSPITAAPATASPMATPPAVSTRPSVTAVPAPSATPIAPLTETFTSNIHGITIGYPTGWVPRPATEPWPEGEIVKQESAFGDIIEDGSTGDTAFLALASRPLGNTDFDQWADGYLAAEGCAPSEPTTVDGFPGISGAGCTLALINAEGRAYLIWLYRIDDREAFEGILRTADLRPEDAVDAE